MAGPTLTCDYYDGQRAASQPVRLHVADGQLHIVGDGVQRSEPLRRVRWAERQRHGERLTYLPGHGLLRHADGPAWDTWVREQNLGDPWVVRAMQSWRGVLLALLLTVGAIVAAWRWGLPWVSARLAAHLPAAVEQTLGDQALAQFDARGLAPSELPPARQAEIRRALDDALNTADGAAPALAWTLHFRRSGRWSIGPNAFALPGGHIVLTDELVELLADAPDVLTGVLAHEYGHVRERHGLRSVIQAGAVSLAAGLVVGDISNLLVLAPLMLSQQAYSRGFEREADADAARVLAANGLDPARMVLLFDRLDAAQDEQSTGLPIALASHPAGDERRRFFREYGR